MTTVVPSIMTGLPPGASIQSAINALPAGGGVVRLGPGAHTLASSLTLRSGVVLQGEGSQSTTVNYTGAAQAVKMATPAARAYGVQVKGIKFVDLGTGTIGLDLASVSSGVFDDVVVDGFVTGVSLTGSDGYCVYNRFTNVTVANATTGWVVGGIGSNSNTFLACRANYCTTGWSITDSNQNQLTHCQIESGTTGVVITSTTNALADRNTIAFTRFEGNTTNISITSANVRETFLVGNHHVTGAFTDSGTRTTRIDPFGTTGPNLKVVSANTAAATGAFEFERTTAAASGEPAMVVRDSNAGSGTPVTFQAETERSTGSFFRGRRGGVTYFDAYASGALGISDGVTAPGTVAGMAQLYVDAADGDLKVKFSDGVVKTIATDT